MISEYINMKNTTTKNYYGILKNPCNPKFSREFAELQARFAPVKRKECLLFKIVNFIKNL